jgi:hypothetical protein
MQYTAPSFSDPLAATFPSAFAVDKIEGSVSELFPPPVTHAVERADVIVASGYQSVLARIAGLLAALRVFHKSRVQQYLLYMFFALIALLLYSSRLVRP